MKLHHYNAELIRIIDGDTIDVMLDLGFYVWVKKRIRLYGIDTPETRNRDLEVKERGKAASFRLAELISSNKFTISSHGLDKYGRCLGTIFVGDENINNLLISEGFAKEYYGK